MNQGHPHGQSRGLTHANYWGKACVGLTLFCALGCPVACSDRISNAAGSSKPTPEQATTGPGAATNSAAALKEQFERAQAAIADELNSVALAGAPEFEKRRGAIVARAKAEPVFFRYRPLPEENASIEITSLRQEFEHTDYAWRTLSAVLKHFKNNKAALRKVVLTNGYLYSEDPNRAFTLVSMLSPAKLFDGEPIWIQRGERVYHAQPDAKGDYIFADGLEHGKRVKLFHLDRIGTGPIPDPLHVDLRALKYRLFFERARVQHIGDKRMVVDLRYGEHWVPTLLDVQGAHLESVTEAIDPKDAESIASARRASEKRIRAASKLRAAMRAAIDEGLPFDEPKTEYEQEDGKLRRVWRTAYEEGRLTYKYNDDRYYVFGLEGQPLVPQVCIDFMVDTFDRAGGSWFMPRSAGKRERSIGKLKWGDDVDTKDLRRTQNFVNYARSHPESFDVLDFPESERVELGYKDLFFNWLSKRVDNFEAGDIVFIRGMTPWDEVEEHSHSFFVYETDPVSGIPIAIAGNAGPANLWSWETECRRTPNRTLRTRIRPLLPWLESFLDLSETSKLDPPELVSGKK